MLDAMMRARVGDDVLGDDPTVNALQERCAALFGKEVACFMPSATMANLASVRAQTEPGDEIVLHAEAHIYYYETGGFAGVCGCAPRFVMGERGLFDVEELERVVRGRDDHFARTRLVAIENTHNRGGGAVWPSEQLARVAGRAKEMGLRTHMDGARLWNAHVACGAPLATLCEPFDTVQACFSKGLGCPAGAIVAGDRETIARVRRFRKMFGGAMRQSGILAAAAMFALDHHLERLRDDHRRARRLAELLARSGVVEIDPALVETNLVYFRLPEGMNAAAFCRRMDESGVRMLDESATTVRAVTHLHVDDGMIEEAAERIVAALGSPSV